MINKMKVFLMAIVCCSVVSMMDLKAKQEYELTGVQESRLLDLFLPKGASYRFIENPEVNSPAGETIRDIVKSVYAMYPRTTAINAAIITYQAIEKILPKGYLKGGLMPFIKEVAADYQDELDAMGRS